jgi:hypothetical protein
MYKFWSNYFITKTCPNHCNKSVICCNGWPREEFHCLNIITDPNIRYNGLNQLWKFNQKASAQISHMSIVTNLTSLLTVKYVRVFSWPNCYNGYLTVTTYLSDFYFILVYLYIYTCLSIWTWWNLKETKPRHQDTLVQSSILYWSKLKTTL